MLKVDVIFYNKLFWHNRLRFCLFYIYYTADIIICQRFFISRWLNLPSPAGDRVDEGIDPYKCVYNDYNQAVGDDAHIVPYAKPTHWV